MANLQDDSEEGVSLFPMFDILACTLGVMVLSAAYEATVPVVRGPPSGTEPVVVLAERGTVRPLDVRRPPVGS